VSSKPGELQDLSASYAAYCEDGHGRAAHDPAMMVALLLYAYATGRPSSRVIERACVDDVAFRVIAANQRPDHCTIARFRQRHEAALAGLFSDVLELCADPGLVGVAVLAVDGTKVHANASQHQIARQRYAISDGPTCFASHATSGRTASSSVRMSSSQAGSCSQGWSG